MYLVFLGGGGFVGRGVFFLYVWSNIEAKHPPPPSPATQGTYIGRFRIIFTELNNKIPVSCGADIRGNLLCSFDIVPTDH